MAEAPLREVRPSGWIFFWYWAFCWLIVPLIIVLMKRASLVLRIYPDRLSLETGLLSKRILELYVADIRTIEITQSVWQRMVNIGELNISTAGPGDEELIARGIPDPHGVHDLIQELRRKAVAQQAPATSEAISTD